jgi:hypothetical protein
MLVLVVAVPEGTLGQVVRGDLLQLLDLLVMAAAAVVAVRHQTVICKLARAAVE